jgi:hypothetical protein
MVWVKRVLAVIVIAFVGLMVLQMVASESGEVVVLSTLNDDGKPEETRLWVVDIGDHQYLRAGQAGSGWFARLQATPRVALERGDARGAYDAVPAPDRLDEVNGLMRQKYGWADRFIELMFGREDAIPVRLQPAVDF